MLKQIIQKAIKNKNICIIAEHGGKEAEHRLLRIVFCNPPATLSSFMIIINVPNYFLFIDINMKNYSIMS